SINIISKSGAVQKEPCENKHYRSINDNDRNSSDRGVSNGSIGIVSYTDGNSAGNDFCQTSAYTLGCQCRHKSGNFKIRNGNTVNDTYQRTYTETDHYGKSYRQSCICYHICPDNTGKSYGGTHRNINLAQKDRHQPTAAYNRVYCIRSQQVQKV